MSSIRERFLDLSQQPTISAKDASDLAFEVASASPEELSKLTAEIPHAAEKRPDLFTRTAMGMVLSAQQERTKSLVSSEAVGVYSGPMARFQAAEYIELKRETQGFVPIDVEKLDQVILAKAESIATRARDNMVSEPLEVDRGEVVENERMLAAFAPIGKAVIGLNKGLDQISAASVEFEDHDDDRMVTISAFDRAGYQVADVRLEYLGNLSLGIEIYHVAHGRNADAVSERKVGERTPGFGNPLFSAVFLENLVESAVAAGYSEISYSSPQTREQGFGKKLGFVEVPHDKKIWGNTIDMRLDLTNVESVRRLFNATYLMRAFVDDVENKDVASQLVDSGLPIDVPDVDLNIEKAEAGSRINFVLQAPGVLPAKAVG